MLINKIREEYKNRNSYSSFDKEVQSTYEAIILNTKSCAREGIDHFAWKTGFVEDEIVETVYKKLANDGFILCQTEYGVTISGWA